MRKLRVPDQRTYPCKEFPGHRAFLSYNRAAPDRPDRIGLHITFREKVETARCKVMDPDRDTERSCALAAPDRAADRIAIRIERDNKYRAEFCAGSTGKRKRD